MMSTVCWMMYRAEHMNALFEIKNYQMFRNTTVSVERHEQGGGHLVYVKDGINCKRRYDLECE